MTDIYDDFDRAFGKISAYAVLRDGKAVGRVAMKHGNQVTAYFQLWGAPMQKGIARGGNYDRATAAIESAAAKLPPITDRPEAEVERQTVVRVMCDPDLDGMGWSNRLEGVGYTVSPVIA
jgi:hypothetical protein